jgi:hypothetical protein
MLLLVALSVSCGTEKKDASADVVIRSFSAETNASFFADVFSEVRAVPLDLGESVLGGALNYRLRAADDRYVLTDRQNSAIYAFDRDGALLARIAKVGRGPGEYQYPLCCEYVNQRYIVLADGQRVIEYDDQGELIQETALDFEMMDFTFVDPATPVFAMSRMDGEPDADRVLVCNADYEVQSSFLPQPFQLFNYETQLTKVAGGDGAFLYLDPTAPRIVRCDREQALSTCEFDFKGRVFPEKLLASDDFEKILDILLQTPEIYCIYKAFENDDYLLLALQYLADGEEKKVAQWLVRKDDGSSRIEYLDYLGDSFSFLGPPQLLTADNEVLYIVDMDLYASVADEFPELAAAVDAKKGFVMLVCKLKETR